ncbi:hypothetical protein [Deinococcus sp. 6GRE01]|uniref:hypothetical protein n=1 Tax=Deinococcus sp. 6GRE01 TaxID=2745873 RepID=UPI001E6089EA|nr:hypothetical protein [Deinococcus sp. 6GRE01]MCD0155970.1 hypothetical protein [Deinococcus sp. 6GRE01]
MEIVQPETTESYTLIETLTGPSGVARRYNRTDGAEFGMSRDRWLIHLPALDERTAETPEGVTGVFVLEAIISGHATWDRFRGGVLPGFDRAYQITLCEAFETNACASDPESAYDISDPVLGDHGDDLTLLPHLLRVWAEELVAGRLHPFEVAVGCDKPELWEPYFASLTARADAARQGA